MTGVEWIARAFETARAEHGRAALMPYLMGGFPDLATSREIGLAYVRGGADLIELGVPFSDPLADGPVIQAAGSAALAAGAHLEDVLELAGTLAQHVPVIVMCYANVVLSRGFDRFAFALEQVGASGLIVPDLPLEEAHAALAKLDGRGLALVPLVAPTTPPDRLKLIGSEARGFLYTVSLTGTTGERVELDDSLAPLIARVRECTAVPVAVGFGIGTPGQARAAAAAGADGVIVGSRLVRAAGEAVDPAGEVEKLVGEFAAALHGGPLG